MSQNFGPPSGAVPKQAQQPVITRLRALCVGAVSARRAIDTWHMRLDLTSEMHRFGSASDYSYARWVALNLDQFTSFLNTTS